MWMANKLPESCIHPCQALISHSVKMVVLCRQRTLTFMCTIPPCFLVLNAVVNPQKYSFSLSTISLYLTVFDSQTYWRITHLVPKKCRNGFASIALSGRHSSRISELFTIAFATASHTTPTRIQVHERLFSYFSSKSVYTLR